MIITIDGPVASGKSSIAKALAQKLGFICMSSGSLYRALAYVLVHTKNYTISTISAPAIIDVQDVLQNLQIKWDAGGSVVYQGQPLDPFLKTEEVSQAASLVSTCGFVRDAINAVLRSAVKDTNVVAEGRDMGSVVFPDAAYKFFITASVPVRARRWQSVQKQQAIDLTLEQAYEAVRIRDERDTTRAIAPLIIPHGAIVIDSSDQSIEEVVRAIVTDIIKHD